jgi:hypothetical protein
MTHQLAPFSTSRVPRLLSWDQIDKRVETSEVFVQLVKKKGKGILSNIITMDESPVYRHTQETKCQTMQWLKKGTQAQ